MAVTVDGTEVEVTLVPMCGMLPGTRSGDANGGQYDVTVYVDGKRIEEVASFDIDRRMVTAYVVDQRTGPLTTYKAGPDGQPLKRMVRGRVEVVDNVTGRVER